MFVSGFFVNFSIENGLGWWPALEQNTTIPNYANVCKLMQFDTRFAICACCCLPKIIPFRKDFAAPRKTPLPRPFFKLKQASEFITDLNRTQKASKVSLIAKNVAFQKEIFR